MEKGQPNPCENLDTSDAEYIVDDGSIYPARLYRVIQETKKDPSLFETKLRPLFLAWAKGVISEYGSEEDKALLFDPSSVE